MMARRVVMVLLGLIYVLPVWGQDRVAQDILNKVNMARNAGGVASLVWNAQLAVAAQGHSDDMAQHHTLEHRGSDGSEFWQRMLNVGYNLTTGAENLLVRPDVDAQSTYEQWWNSAPHRSNMMNPDYVEVGIAYTASNDGTYYFTMVLGARSGIIPPPLASATVIVPSPIPATATLIPPTIAPPTMIPPTAVPSPIPTATLIPVPGTMAIAPQITALPTLQPATAFVPSATPYLEPDIRLVYSATSFSLINISGKRVDLSNLSFSSDSGSLAVSAWDTDFLTEKLNDFSSQDCLQAWGFDTVDLPQKPDDCRFRHAWISVGQGQLFWQGVTQFYVFKGQTAIGLCYLVDQSCDVSFEARIVDAQSDTDDAESLTQRDIRLLFSPESFTILSTADHPIDLRGLLFVSDSGRLSIESWNTEFLTQSLSSFTSKDCLQAWPLTSANQEKPSACNVRHGWIMVGDDADFWRDTTRFSVIRNNIVLAGCVIANGSCAVSLQGNLGVNSPTVVPASLTSGPNANTSSSASTSNDLTFVYDSNSFSLINTSGHTLDISSLQFESENGIFSAQRWDTDALTSPLNDFASGGCLQVWEVGGQLLPQASDCRTRHGWIAVTQGQLFWHNATEFRVKQGAQVLTSCSISSGRCVVNLP